MFVSAAAGALTSTPPTSGTVFPSGTPLAFRDVDCISNHGYAYPAMIERECACFTGRVLDSNNTGVVSSGMLDYVLETCFNASRLSLHDSTVPLSMTKLLCFVIVKPAKRESAEKVLLELLTSVEVV